MGLGEVPAGGKWQLPPGPPVTASGGLEFTFQRVGRFNWTISLCDGFLCSITTKIHQMELRGFNAGNCGAKRSVIGLSNESGENAIENEAGLALNSTRVMAQACSPQPAVLRTPVPNPPPACCLHWAPWWEPQASLSLPVLGCRRGVGGGGDAGMLLQTHFQPAHPRNLRPADTGSPQASLGWAFFSPSDVDNLLPPGLCSGPWSLCLDSVPRLPTLVDFSFYRWSGAFLTFPR